MVSLRRCGAKFLRWWTGHITGRIRSWIQGSVPHAEQILEKLWYKFLQILLRVPSFFVPWMAPIQSKSWKFWVCIQNGSRNNGDISKNKRNYLNICKNFYIIIFLISLADRGPLDPVLIKIWIHNTDFKDFLPERVI